MKGMTVITALLLSLLLIAANANATLFEVSFTGHLTEVHDTTGTGCPSCNTPSLVFSVGDPMTGFFWYSDILQSSTSNESWARFWGYTINMAGFTFYQTFVDWFHGGDSWVNLRADGSVLLFNDLPLISPSGPHPFAVDSAFSVEGIVIDLAANDIGSCLLYGYLESTSLGESFVLGTFDRVSRKQVPEPSTILLLGVGIAGLVVFWRFRIR